MKMSPPKRKRKLRRVTLEKRIAKTKVEGGALVPRKPALTARAEWADVAQQLAKHEDDALVMGEFGNKGDAELDSKGTKRQVRSKVSGRVLKRTARIGVTHITPIGGNIFLDLGFAPKEAARLQAETKQIIEAKKRLIERMAKNTAGASAAIDDAVPFFKASNRKLPGSNPRRKNDGRQ